MSDLWIVTGLTAAFMVFTRYPVLCRPPRGMPEWVNRPVEWFWCKGVEWFDARIVWILTGLNFFAVLALWPFGLVFAPGLYLGMLFLAAYLDVNCHRAELKAARKVNGETHP